MKRSKIGWTGLVWNPAVGCTRVNTECRHCYAFELHDKRHKAYLDGKKLSPQYAKPFSEIQVIPARLDAPLRWKKPNFVFVNSMGDLWHRGIHASFIRRCYQTMTEASWHIFQVLTKRPWRRSVHFGSHTPPPNVWEGISIGRQSSMEIHLPALRKTRATLKFLSIEPLLGPIRFPAGWLDGIKWAIIGCESRGARSGRLLIDQAACHGVDAESRSPLLDQSNERAWLREASRIVDQLRHAGVAVFVKQIPIDGRVVTDIEQFPPNLAMQDYPDFNHPVLTTS